MGNSKHEGIYLNIVLNISHVDTSSAGQDCSLMSICLNKLFVLVDSLEHRCLCTAAEVGVDLNWEGLGLGHSDRSSGQTRVASWSSLNICYGGSDTKETKRELHKERMERVKNIQYACCPPFYMVDAPILLHSIKHVLISKSYCNWLMRRFCTSVNTRFHVQIRDLPSVI
jgi:hypothetical protein